jgi:hypothetical protein
LHLGSDAISSPFASHAKQLYIEKLIQKWIQEPKWVQEGLKIKVLIIASKQDVCVDLVVMNPTQLERAQTDTVCERYRVLFVLPNMQNFDDCIVHTVLTWQLTVQAIQ